MKLQEFAKELEKLSFEKKRKSNLRAAAEGILAGGIGYGAGYGTGKYLIPAVTGKPPNISPRVAKLLGILSGAGAVGMYALQGRHIHDNEIRSNSGKTGPSRSVQSGNRKLIVRRKRHPSEVSSGVLLPDAKRSESFSFRAGRRLADSRKPVRSDHYGQRHDKYRYNRKKTRDYSFEGDVRVRKPRT